MCGQEKRLSSDTFSSRGDQRDTVRRFMLYRENQLPSVISESLVQTDRGMVCVFQTDDVLHCYSKQTLFIIRDADTKRVIFFTIATGRSEPFLADEHPNAVPHGFVRLPVGAV
ncbi:hypothetical protein ROHU_022647 [Labeo rohita]|uniref:Uncharacterized protein n=1 Tax=Labeo rohita TaxID=84645 RepID=A0A498MQ29_LABRO|nr:hypothetical protein ROHU_022647 [Labeo rohita]